jgi:hypothetical protein
MKIALKKLKVALHLSEETTAYTADLYIDGHKAAHCRNDGRGGADLYQPYDQKSGQLTDAAEAHFRAQKVTILGTEMDGSPEIAVGELIERELTKRKIQRDMRNRVLLIDDGQVYEVRAPKGVEPDIERLQAVTKGATRMPSSSTSCRSTRRSTA